MQFCLFGLRVSHGDGNCRDLALCGLIELYDVSEIAAFCMLRSYSEDRCSRFHRNCIEFLLGYTASRPRRQYYWFYQFVRMWEQMSHT